MGVDARQPLIWVTDTHTQIILASLGIVVDCLRIDYVTYTVYGRLLLWKRTRQSKREDAAAAAAVAAGTEVPTRKWHHLPTEAINMRLTGKRCRAGRG